MKTPSPSPLVLAADQLAQVAEKQLEFLEAGGFAEATELRTAVSSYRKVREGL